MEYLSQMHNYLNKLREQKLMAINGNHLQYIWT